MLHTPWLYDWGWVGGVIAGLFFGGWGIELAVADYRHAIRNIAELEEKLRRTR
jgi:hypothetical protein